MKRHRFWITLFLCLTVLLISSVKSNADLAMEKFRYVQDFEEKAPVEFWTSNGEHEVNFKGITDEKAFSGKKSFKLDVTLKSGNYHYWAAPVRVPCEGKLKFSARILVAEPTNARVGLGANFVFPPSHHSGCGAIDTFDKPTGEWMLQETDLVERGKNNADSVVRKLTSEATGDNVGVYLDRWGIFIYGGKGKRVVVYVDDVKIEGEVPRIDSYEDEILRRWQPAKEAFLKHVATWREELKSAGEDLESLNGLSTFAQRIKENVVQVAEAAKSKLDEIEKRGYSSPQEKEQIESNLKLMRQTRPGLARMSEPGFADRPYVAFISEAITNNKILPDEFPITGEIADQINVTACAGEYEPAAFAFYAFQKVEGLKITATELKSGDHTIPASAVDICIVKPWFQSGTSIQYAGKRLLTPELLLKDDGLVKVDMEEQHNYLRTPDAAGKDQYVLISGENSDNMSDIQPRDAESFQPVDIDAETNRQFWITVHVPEDAAPGEYEGTISLTPANAPPAEIGLRLRVLPFALERPALRYSIYYRGVMNEAGEGSISSELKSPAQYEAEMRDLHAHGVDYPASYQNFKMLGQVFEIREKAGMPKESFYTLGGSVGNTTDPEKLKALDEKVRKWVKFAGEHGYGEVYFYGIDEATGDRLKSQRQAWKTVRDAGGKMFVACYKGTFETMGDLLNLAIFAGRPVPEEADKYHGIGHQIFSYANSQVGVEEPETYRRNFGLALWKARFDGAMDYAYQHSFGHLWNDFDNSHYRDHNFTYATVDGVIDTVQWEGFREGVDDVRYLTTLLKAIEKSDKPLLASEAQKWVDEMDTKGDLNSLRGEIIKLILGLQKIKE